MATATVAKADKSSKAPVKGRFGVYGGRYVPETLMAALEELEIAGSSAVSTSFFEHTRADLRRCFLRGS
jgi:tryptophan synthase beta chain